ncbi:MAG: SLBB domain-containing protein, partial [Bacillales bacterium]
LTPYETTDGASGLKPSGGEKKNPWIVVDIKGAVKKPGIYRLENEARVHDAVLKAGGARSDADLGQVNLAERLSDGKVVYIPKKGEIVYLRENYNISTGGDSIDYTDEMPDSYKDIAVRAAKAVGAVFCGVDMVIDDIGEEAGPDNYGIIEINFNPAIHIHCYPYKGKNRHPEEKILALLGFGNKEAAKNGEKLHDKVAAGRKVTI